MVRVRARFRLKVRVRAGMEVLLCVLTVPQIGQIHFEGESHRNRKELMCMGKSFEAASPPQGLKGRVLGPASIA